jgi:predicted nuclease with RNAse H fold
VVVGVDVAAERLHCVALDVSLRVADARMFAAAELGDLVRWARAATIVAVDAPAELSTAPHASESSLSPKFARARCAEIALGRRYGLWVPFVAPLAGEPIATWMKTGLALFEEFDRTSTRVIEVFPYAGYRRLVAPERLAKKSLLDGARQRITALDTAGVTEARLEMWSHDGLDALLAAMTAARCAEGVAVEVTCGHDGSAIWLPE